MTLNKKYKTHSVQVNNHRNIFEIKVLLNGEIFSDLVLNVFSINEERKLINEFIQKIFNSNEYIFFSSSFEYFDFCHGNSLEPKEQSWFKTIFYRGDLNSLKFNLELKSISFQELYFSSEDTFENKEIRYNSNLPDPNNLKIDVYKLKNTLIENNIFKLYHFTDITNLKSIFDKGGLYSWFYLKDKMVKNTFASTNLSKDLDSHKMLENYVRLSFNSAQPMMHKAIYEKRINHPIIIEIDPSVIFLKETLFSDRNATDRNAIIGNSFDNFNCINFKVAKKDNYFDLDNEGKKSFQSEVLVHEKIRTEFFLNLDKLKKYIY
ncbi:DarT ssDNA thymidine ADP-ribosyltransferase family protein [Cyclobacterium jeungdonense]|uniref:DarT ssDNA thymidine ADP-ribosyltransferase family protein n=1 Tax=Cyclobacterium jeungdonense TaxID=708087 RepID=A0ABT8C3A2_9BACT|nr:DarT ssDNA thymidine ADP-ribosyltransferase family protein [Cyclobacterium jeungdonense]MDN3687234.1 DarT ssDNA thymidine ADP-ribosyltransferase family protein [Cyclobacterium jeungdonense]